MKILNFITAVILLSSCGGELSKEKREAFKEEMKARDIKRVQEEDVVAEAFRQGEVLYKNYLSGADSLAHVFDAREYFLTVNDTVKNTKDHELMEAYKYSAARNADLSDNVQRDGEVMIYSAPKVENGELKGVYIIRIPRKQLILRL